MEQTKVIINKNLLLLLCFTGFLLNYLTYFPGFMSPDSFDQFGQALRGEYDDWHPPVMAYVWRLMNKIEEGPELMLAMQLALLWLSCYLFCISIRSSVWRVVVFLAFYSAPFIHNFAGWIIKDMIMAFSWLLAIAILFSIIHRNGGEDGGRRSKWLVIPVGLLLLYGCWLRYNAIVALLPLSVALVWIFWPEKTRKTKILYSMSFVLLVYFGQPLFNKYFLKAHVNYTEAQIYFHDLAAIFVKTGDNVFPDYLYENPEFDTAYIRTHYDPLDVTALLWNPDHKTLLHYNKETVNSMKSAWFKLLKEYPMMYIKHRVYIYKYFLALEKKKDLQYYYIWMHPNDYGFKVYETTLYRKYANSISAQKNKIYFQTWFWIFLNILLLPLCFLVRDRNYRLLYFTVALSGFLYTAPQIIVANYVTDFRYIYWSCFACFASVIIFLADRMPRRLSAGN
ncbi:MAG TPA: hypothetical protein VIN07_01100 [Flavipsychrobacter sp.]